MKILVHFQLDFISFLFRLYLFYLEKDLFPVKSKFYCSMKTFISFLENFPFFFLFNRTPGGTIVETRLH